MLEMYQKCVKMGPVFFLCFLYQKLAKMGPEITILYVLEMYLKLAKICPERAYFSLFVFLSLFLSLSVVVPANKKKLLSFGAAAAFFFLTNFRAGCFFFPN